ncbi:MAG: hypothetical protein NT105_17080 [Verrucomicrobia bacterium]|nr:hypothetical protein [Verrucomicrobiota bacterium]
MNDNEIRGLVLKRLYDERHRGWIRVRGADFTDGISGEEAARICDQLGDHNLIRWQPVKDHTGRTVTGTAQIVANGVDVVENGGVGAPLNISFKHIDQSIQVTNSQNIQVGNGNVQGVNIDVGRLVAAINGSTVTDTEKREAKSRLIAFLKHPLVKAILVRLVPGIEALINAIEKES